MSDTGDAHPPEAGRPGRREGDELAALVAAQAAQLDELRDEVGRLREGEVRDALAPFLRGLARLADDLRRIGDAGGPVPVGASAADVAYLSASVEDLLHDAGVTPIHPAAGEPFDPVLHHDAGTRPTADVLRDRTVAEVRRRGLRRDDGRLLRPVEVVVHRFALDDEPG